MNMRIILDKNCWHIDYEYVTKYLQMEGDLECSTSDSGIMKVFLPYCLKFAY